MNLNTDPIDIDLANYLDRLDEEDKFQEAVEALQADVISDFYSDHESCLDSDFLTWFDEEGVTWEVVELVKHWREGELQEALEGFERLCNKIDEEVVEEAWGYAEEGLKKTDEEV